IILGPEMRSTGEVMGVAETFPEAFLKAQLATGQSLPEQGRVFVSVRDTDKPAACELAQRLVAMGFEIVATGGTRDALKRDGVDCDRVNKVTEGQPHIVDAILNGEVDMIVNTTQGAQAILDSQSLRRQTLLSGVAYFTTIAAATAAVAAMERLRDQGLRVQTLQEYHQRTKTASEFPPALSISS
ncbi:MAG: carbamoyl phosphate synthase large subunit, partial [Myxococcota bacterium]